MEKTIRFTPKNISYLEAGFLSDDEQEAYEDAVKRFKNERAKESLRVPLKGTNLFKVLLLNQIGIRTATLPELDQIIQADKDYLKGTFEDAPSVALRSYGDSIKENDYLAKTVAKLVKKRKFSQPIVINGLEIKEDNNSAYGLNFKKGKYFDYFVAPELSHSNDRRKFTRQDERGMPIFDDNGTRALYTRGDGLSRLGFGGGLGLGSSWGGLDDSDGDGRVVIVKTSEAGSQKIKAKK